MSGSPSKAAWWRGTRGEWYVAVQVALIALVFLGPRAFPGLPPWPASLARSSRAVGVAMMAAGGGLLAAGAIALGSSLTPMPRPRSRATLVETGPYRFVRHPMYAGGIVIAYGWALAVQGWLTLVYATLLLAFLDFKSTSEERWLAAKFAGYTDYMRRVRKLIPFVY